MTLITRVLRWARTVLEALVARNGFDTSDVDDVVWGTSSQVSEQGGDLGRMAALDAGYAVTASGVTLDRFCGSGITATNFAANAVMAGMGRLLEQDDLKELQFDVQRSDIELISALNGLGVEMELGPVSGTVRLTDFVGLMESFHFPCPACWMPASRSPRLGKFGFFLCTHVRSSTQVMCFDRHRPSPTIE